MTTDLPGNGPDRHDSDGRPGNGRQKRGPPSGIALRLLVIGAVAAFILYVQSGGDVPFLHNPRAADTTPSTTGDGSYFTLESQGIRLGPVGGTLTRVDEPAPDFALRDLNGNVVRLSDFRGDTVVMNFWASWCAPCREEFPELVSNYEKYKDRGLVMVAVNLEEPREAAARFANDFAATFPIVLDTEGSVARRYRVLGLPTTWFVDSEGIVRSQVVGLVTPGLLKKNLEEAGFRPIQ